MGALSGFRVLEIAGIGPGPFCAMMLADMGAEVIRLDRARGKSRSIDLDADPALDITARGRLSIAMDLKNPQATKAVLRLCSRVDALIEGFRPGVMEKLGLGPEDCLAVNPRLVYGRMTGWGQSGPMAQVAGHDINYLALSGILHLFGRATERPSPPLNLVADMGGGGMMLAFGIVSALLERERSGKGQVVDAAMCEGAALLATSVFAQKAMGWWRDARGSNLLDSGAHFYEVYETSDHGFFAVGAIEPQFYALLLRGLGLDPASLPPQMDRKSWPAMKQRFQEIFATRTRDEWARVFEGSDACAAPVLSPAEAARHPHARARGSYIDDQGVARPVAAPRLSRSASASPAPAPRPGRDSERILVDFGFSAEERAQLFASGAVAAAATD
jgi:alpha-methylacyl-CoA racemase